MKKILISAALAAFAALFVVSCQKERIETTSDTSVKIDFREKGKGEYTKEELAQIEQQVKDITDFKDKLDSWREGWGTDETLEASMAIDRMEVVWNFYLSRPGKAFREYEMIRDSISLEDMSDTWSGATVAEMFELTKEILTDRFEQVAEEDKSFQFIDFGISDVYGTKQLYIMANIGLVEIEEPVEHPFEGIRWAASPFGFSQTNGCFGAANELIGWSVNANLGFFLQNLPPAPINGGNPLVDPSVVILTTIQQAQTNFFGTPFPLAGAPAPLIVESTFNNPAFENPTYPPNPPINPGNEPTDYLAQGQYQIHADFSIAPALPDESCFLVQKLQAYTLSNRDVGEEYLPQINQLAPQPFPFFNLPNTLLATYVGANATTALNPLGQVYLQEHPTYHFYAVALRFISPVPLPDSPREL